MTSDTAQSGIDVAALERELKEQWKQKAEAAQEADGQAVTRTCVLNLVVWAPGADSGEVAAAVAEVSGDHPCRSLVLLPHADAPEDSMSANVSTFCHLAGAGRQQVCSEQLIITAEGKRVAQLPSAVRPLLVPDLDTALWWRDVPGLDNPVFGELVDVTRRVILDSHYYRDPSQGLKKLAGFVQQHRSRKAFSDLAWTRMSAFRRQVAAFYDVPDYRSYLDKVGHVEIVCGRGSQEGIPGQPLLVAAWLSSRLGWQPRGRFEWPDSATAQVSLERNGTPVQVVIRVNEGDPGLTSVKLVAGGDQAATFTAALSDDRSHVKQEIRIGERARAGKIQRYYRRPEAFLLARELEILGHDRVYEQALGAVPGLVG